uniref:Uncharacterized protein n=1 Tax=Ditylenchus dipsaci TaxID=166011 RepID=A0A915E8M1_9BILA
MTSMSFETIVQLANVVCEMTSVASLAVCPDTSFCLLMWNVDVTSNTACSLCDSFNKKKCHPNADGSRPSLCMPHPNPFPDGNSLQPYAGPLESSANDIGIGFFDRRRRQADPLTSGTILSNMVYPPSSEYFGRWRRQACWWNCWGC